MNSEKALRCILIVGVAYVLVLFIGGVSWKQSAIRSIPQVSLQPIYRFTYGIPCREKQITEVSWSGGETKFDRDNPEIVWFKLNNSDKWTKSKTEELTADLVYTSKRNRQRLARIAND